MILFALFYAEVLLEMGDGTNDVALLRCKECKEAMTKQIEEVRRVSEKRLDAHADQADTMDKLLIEVVTLQKIQLKNQELQEARLRSLEDQVLKHATELAVEKEAKARESRPSASSCTPSGSPWWKEKWVCIVVITVCVILVSLVGAAIGQSLLADYLDAMKAIP